MNTKDLTTEEIMEQLKAETEEQKQKLQRKINIQKKVNEMLEM